MRVSELYAPAGPFVGEDLYVVGLGPSMRHYPARALEGRTCILLNDAHRIFPTLGPVAFANHDSFLGLFDRERERWARVNGQFVEVKLPEGNPHERNLPGEQIRHRICRGRTTRPFERDPRRGRDDNLVPWDHPEIHVFSFRSRACGDDWDYSDDRALWSEKDHYWSSVNGTVAEFALQFCAWAGARAIFLCGIDCRELGGKHYCDPGVECDRRDRAIGGRYGRRDGGRRDEGTYREQRDYPAYLAGLNRLRREIQERFSIPVISCSPFIGLGRTS